MGSPWHSEGTVFAALGAIAGPSADEGAGVIQREQRHARGGGQACQNCPRCGLTIYLRAPWLAVRFCPRCLARSQAVVELFSSSLPTDALYADGSAPRADR